MMTKLVKALVVAFAVSSSLFVSGGYSAAKAQADTLRIGPGESVSGRRITLGVNQSMVVETSDAVRDLLVSNPAVADAVIRTSNRVFIVAGSEPATTSIFLFGEGGHQIAGLELAVEPQTSHLVDTIQALMPNSNIRAVAVNGSIVLSGQADAPVESSRAFDIAAQMVGDPEKVVNMISITANDQVYLKVTIAEMDRTITRELGIDISGSANVGNAVIAGTSNTTGIASGLFTDFLNGAGPYPVDDSLGGFGAGVVSGDQGLLGTSVRALEERGILRTLAEPTLTAVSGESASFLVGGEIPIPTVGINGLEVIFKKFGVSLSFRPVVLSPGRISLQVETEVSEVDPTINVAVGEGISVPGFKVRRANTVVELPSGGAMVLGGLLRDNITQQAAGIPGVQNLPILGTLFKSRDFLRRQTELVVFVTPLLVDPVATSKLRRPDQNFQAAADAESIFLDRLNRRYQVPGQHPSTSRGSVGFIFD